MPVQELKAQIGRLPKQPGVYLFLNAAGRTLYVGKARALRDRVRSYLGARGTSPKTDALLDEVDRLDVIVTDSVVEALALENHLIKHRAPKYNILLRDDKNYPYLRLTTSEAFPRVLVARRVERDADVYAGPFLPASFARQTMTLAHRLCGVRSCNEVITGKRGRPCLEYDIKRCLAPCVETLCSPAQYAEAVGHARLFLEGRNDELIVHLEARMAAAADAERFEQAAQLRDAMRTVEALRDRQQKMAGVRLGDRDAFGVKVGPAGASVQVFQVRGGRVIERVDLGTEADQIPGDTEADVLQAALPQFYESRPAPPEIHVPVEIEEREALEGWLADRAGRRVRILVPRRGDRRGLIALAARNAALAYRSRFGDLDPTTDEAADALRVALALPAKPRRIEGFDISTIQGRDTVAALVVSDDGRMRRSEYRKFRVRGEAGRRSQHLSGPDDFAAMHEVVLRRYRRLLEQGGPFPDLILIDGGKGQLSAAYGALERLGLVDLIAVALAKKVELVFTRDRVEPLALPREGLALRLLQRVRDEAHRFAVTFHRQTRTRRDLRSALDAIPGIGARRSRRLLGRFGSVAGVRRATREELVAVVGRPAADEVLRFFGDGNPERV